MFFKPGLILRRLVGINLIQNKNKRFQKKKTTYKVLNKSKLKTHS